MSKKEFEALAEFRYQLRQFLRFSEEVTLSHGATPLQYQLLLQLKGFPGREWATIGELAERLQSKHHGVVALVNRCQALDLVRRQTSTKDSRLVEVHLTAKGDQLVKTIAKLHLQELHFLEAALFEPELRHS